MPPTPPTLPHCDYKTTVTPACSPALDLLLDRFHHLRSRHSFPPASVPEVLQCAITHVQPCPQRPPPLAMDPSMTSSCETASPFRIRPEDIAALDMSEPFQILREHLAINATNGFCSEHDGCSHGDKSTWTLHRDILHALVMPIAQLFNRASHLAEAALCSSKPEDLELAFTGDARSAFLWLQCFMSDEEDWCHTVGCPACIVSHTLSTESHLRLTYTALYLAADHSSPGSLPSFPFLASSLSAAISADPFWGPSQLPYITSRAHNLYTNLRALIAQCTEVEALVSSPQLRPADTQRPLTPISITGVASLKVKPSKMARRQQRMRAEEQAMLQRLVVQCWGAVEMQKTGLQGMQTDAVRALARGQPDGRRRRSLTCP